MKTAPKNERKIRRGKVPCGFILCILHKRDLSADKFMLRKFTNLKIIFCFFFFPYALRSIPAVFPLPAFPFFSDSPCAVYISLVNVLYSTPYYLASIILIISFLNFFTSYIHLRLSRSANFSIVFDVLLYIQILFISITRTCD